jgi:hypothetical protein
MSSRVTPGANGGTEPDDDRLVAHTASEDTAAVDEESRDIGLDQIFSVLKNYRRRCVFRYLRDEDNPATLGEVAEHIAALENDCSTEALSASQRKRAYVGLYQCHLPKMDDLDIIAFDKDRGRLELGPNAPLLDAYLDRTPEEKPPWPSYYLGLAAAALGIVLLATVTGAISTAGALITGIALGPLVGLAAVHFAHARGVDLPFLGEE